jgi:class 3 adenylate cyclase
MFASGVPLPRDDHAIVIFNAALSFIDAILQFSESLLKPPERNKKSVTTIKYITASHNSSNTRNSSRRPENQSWCTLLAPVEIRVGIHSGSVIGSFYSKLKGRYELFGKTVLQAEQLALVAQAGHIHLSTETYRLLPPHLSSTCTVRSDCGFPYTYEVSRESSRQNAATTSEVVVSHNSNNSQNDSSFRTSSLHNISSI